MATRRLTRETGSAEPKATETADNRVDQLIEIACRLFAKHGYERTSLRDIAEEAKITKAALYYYFPNKEALYERIVLQSLGALVDSVSAQVDRAGTPIEKVRAFMLSSADFLDLDRNAWIAGSNAFWSGPSDEPRTAAVHLRDKYEKVLRGCITEAMRTGAFRQMDAAMADRFLLSTLNHICRWHSPGGRLTARQVVEEYLDMALLGMTVR